MKKGIALSLAAIVVLAMGVVAFADSTNEVPQWFNDMIKWRKAQVDQAVKDKVITEEQAKYWKDRLDYMEKFYNENGFGYGFPGACHGGYGGFGRGFGYGPGMMSGYGPGMMGGYAPGNGGYWNYQAPAAQ
ncbi:MAG: hypothetical protein PWQ37_1797 [Candidatus Petromonas sp.]|jgi:hypothetical protein|nr:hypothetical protein [Candidatus Petromonas sp.]